MSHPVLSYIEEVDVLNGLEHTVSRRGYSMCQRRGLAHSFFLLVRFLLETLEKHFLNRSNLMLNVGHLASRTNKNKDKDKDLSL